MSGLNDKDEPKLHRSEISLRRYLLLLKTRPRLFVQTCLVLLASIAFLCSGRLRRRTVGGVNGRVGGGMMRGAHPRIFSYQPIGSFLVSDDGGYYRGWSGLRKTRFRRNVVPMTEHTTESQRRKKSKWYDKKMRYPIGDSRGREHCEAQYAWQETSFPSCNVLHEVDVGHMRHHFGDGRSLRTVDLINNGGWSDIWMVREYDGTKRVLKTKLYKHDFTDRNLDRYRRDALVMERLTAYPNVMNIYGYCGVSHLVEYSRGGDISDAEISSDPAEGELDRLRIAAQVARSVVDLHNFDREGRPSVASTDITPYQFLLIDGVYKLNDFNRARFIAWDKDRDEPCPFYVAKNPGKWRAPEEYAYKGETEKIDVYSIGNIFYFILTGERPFDSIKTEQAYEAIQEGERPRIDGKFRKGGPAVQALLKGMEMCWRQDPKERATARELSDFLQAELTKLEPS